MDALETYLAEVHAIRATGGGTKETSYYGPLERLFNDLGRGLKPRVRCIMQLKNLGADHPDGGFFTTVQVQRTGAGSPLPNQPPARGAVEAKAPSEDVRAIAASAQVGKYLARYNQVLVTNLREFLLIGRDAAGSPLPPEGYSLAGSEIIFWSANPRTLAREQGERFGEYLKRVMLRPAPLTAPRDLAWFLASYAREAKARVDEAASLPGLNDVRTALEEALGLKFEGERGERFFRSTLVQTLFYGVFSAWVLWSKLRTPTDTTARFDWRTAAWTLSVPMISALFEQLVQPSKLKPLGLDEVLDWAGETLNRVDRATFFDSFEVGQAVQYFYEPFLEAFDPQLRKDLGVWYTPPEIVQYQVARVDTVLREELGLPDGLADANVYVLDPCCGTGTYLLEVLRQIHRTLAAKSGDGLLAAEVKRAAIDRVFGFELLPAPFVVAHLQLGLLLRNLGAPLSATVHERAAVYLTNALSGREPPTGAKVKLPFPELESERDAAEQVKRDRPILVVLGNPPYNAYAGVSPVEEHGLVEPFKEGLVREWGIKKFNLDDLYVRFFRLAERRIAEQTGRGVVSYISNFSYLSDPSFVVMRQRLASEFDALWFDCMNGDSRETGKLTPEGKPDPSVFSTEYNREGIRVGTVVCLMVRKATRAEEPRTSFRQFWGTSKRADLLESLSAPSFGADYEPAEPKRSNRFSFRPSAGSADYDAWPSVAELAAVPPMPGVVEKRKGALISIEKGILEHRMRQYFDPTVSWRALTTLRSGLTENAAGYDAESVRERALKAEAFDDARLRPLMMLPMDVRWCYHTLIPSLWNRGRPDYSRQCWQGNVSVATRRKAVANPEGVPFFLTRVIGDDHAFLKDAYYTNHAWPRRVFRARPDE